METKESDLKEKEGPLCDLNSLNWRICMGEKLDLSSMMKKPEIEIPISESQKMIIEMLADKSVDANLETVYVINNLRFKIYPNLIRS